MVWMARQACNSIVGHRAARAATPVQPDQMCIQAKGCRMESRGFAWPVRATVSAGAAEPLAKRRGMNFGTHVSLSTQ